MLNQKFSPNLPRKPPALRWDIQAAHRKKNYENAVFSAKILSFAGMQRQHPAAKCKTTEPKTPPMQ